jgi:hypothetical protein
VCNEYCRHCRSPNNETCDQGQGVVFHRIFAGFLLLTFIWANLLNEVGRREKLWKNRETERLLGDRSLVDADVRKLRVEELSPTGGTGEERMRRIKALKSEINSGFADIVKQSDKEG